MVAKFKQLMSAPFDITSFSWHGRSQKGYDVQSSDGVYLHQRVVGTICLYSHRNTITSWNDPNVNFSIITLKRFIRNESYIWIWYVYHRDDYVRIEQNIIFDMLNDEFSISLLNVVYTQYIWSYSCIHLQICHMSS